MSNIADYLQTEPTFLHATVGYLVRGDVILLGERKRVSLGLGQSLIAGIGGKLEPGETDEAALQRECWEEIGVRIQAYRRMGTVTYLNPHQPKWNQIVSIYLIDAWNGEPHETDDIRPQWFQQTALPADRMWPDNLLTIPRVLAGHSITGTFLYQADGSIAEYELRQDAQSKVI